MSDFVYINYTKNGNYSSTSHSASRADGPNHGPFTITATDTNGDGIYDALSATNSAGTEVITAINPNTDGLGLLYSISTSDDNLTGATAAI